MDHLKLFSVAKSKVKRYLLFRGITLGGLGMCILFVFGVWGTLSFLDVWGFPLFALAILLIAWGLIPYKRFSHLETHPHSILLEEKRLVFISNKGGRWSALYTDIHQLSYFESKRTYGLRIETEKSRVILPYFLRDSRLYEIVHPNKPDERA